MTTNNLTEQELDDLLEIEVIEKSALVGSTYILGKGDDIDYLLFTNNREYLNEKLIAWGFENEGKYKSNTDFTSYRNGVYNLIVTSKEAFFNEFVVAAKVCKFLKLEDKEQRIGVHSIIMTSRCSDVYVEPAEDEWELATVPGPPVVPEQLVDLDAEVRRRLVQDWLNDPHRIVEVQRRHGLHEVAPEVLAEQVLGRAERDDRLRQGRREELVQPFEQVQRQQMLWPGAAQEFQLTNPVGHWVQIGPRDTPRPTGVLANARADLNRQREALERGLRGIRNRWGL